MTAHRTFRQTLVAIAEGHFDLQDYERNACGQFGTDDATCPAALKPGSPRREVLTVAKSAPPTTKPIVLAFGGSFNPPHQGHVQAAKDAIALMQSRGYTVTKLVVAPTADKLLRAKLGDGLYPLAERTAMATIAFAGIPGVEVSSAPALAAEQTPGKLRRTQLADAIAQVNPKATVVNVTGEDAAPGSPPAFPSVYAGDSGTSHEGYYYLAVPRESGGLSSSAVRSALKVGTPIPDGHLDPATEAYLRAMIVRRPEIVLRGDHATAYLLEQERNRCGQWGTDDATCPVPGERGGHGGGSPTTGTARPVTRESLLADAGLVRTANAIKASASFPAEETHALWIAEGRRSAAVHLTTDDTMTRFTDADGVFTPNRLAVHAQIITDMLAGKPMHQAHPIAILSAGLPGAGKSTGLANVNQTDYVTINPDDVKAKLPEYRGNNAGELHEESTYVADKALRVAIANGQHIIFDSTMKALGSQGDSYAANANDGGVARKIADLKAAGYQTDVRFADVTINTAIDRTMTRYADLQERDGTGRFVPPEVVKGSIDAVWGTKPRRTFEAIKDIVDCYTITDNNGRAPVVISSKPCPKR